MDAQGPEAASDACERFVTFTVGGQLFGLPVQAARDVLLSPPINGVPLAPADVAGLLNLRGRIVTAIDLGARLGLAPQDEGAAAMSIVVEMGDELYCLMVDAVGEVVALPERERDLTPPTLAPNLRRYTAGLYRLQTGLLVALDIDRLLDHDRADAA